MRIEIKYKILRKSGNGRYEPVKTIIINDCINYANAKHKLNEYLKERYYPDYINFECVSISELDFSSFDLFESLGKILRP